MIQVLTLSCFAMAVYSAFLMIRGMVRLFKDREMKMFWSVLLAFVLLPALVGVVLLVIPVVGYNSWIAIPALIFIIVWICIGYVLEVYMRKELQRKMDGQMKIIPARPPHWLRNNLLILLVCSAVWIYGICGGYFFNNETFESIIMCLCLFFFGRSCMLLWKYRGF